MANKIMGKSYSKSAMAERKLQEREAIRKIQTPPSTEKFRNNYDRIFRKKTLLDWDTSVCKIDKILRGSI